MTPQQQFTDCLNQIREQLINDHKERGKRMYDTWFAPLSLYHYEQNNHQLTVSVPNTYVYEALEQFFMRPLSKALQENFGDGVKLNYKIGKEPEFCDVAAYLQRQGGSSTTQGRQEIKIPDARKRIEEGLQQILATEGRGEANWLQGYNRVVDWLSDNKGRGLLCVGTSGLGKTLLCRDVLPVILAGIGKRATIVSASEMHSRLDELKMARLLVIDDLGKEPRKHYGEQDNSFLELCSNAERTGNLLIIATSLSTNTINDPLYPDSIEHRYGSEVLDRLKAITTMARFEGKSMRG